VAGGAEVAFTAAAQRPDVVCFIERATEASPPRWTRLAVEVSKVELGGCEVSALDPARDEMALYRFGVELLSR
jgi:hypothetical protein